MSFSIENIKSGPKMSFAGLPEVAHGDNHHLYITYNLKDKSQVYRVVRLWDQRSEPIAFVSNEKIKECAHHSERVDHNLEVPTDKYRKVLFKFQNIHK
jgi:hypothetical protein